MPKPPITYSKLDALYEMIITRKSGKVTHYKYVSVNGEIIAVTPTQFHRLEKKIVKKETNKLYNKL